MAWWIIGGGACYLAGTPFLRLSASIRYAHAVWHVLVMAGSVCHFRAVWLALVLDA